MVGNNHSFCYKINQICCCKYVNCRAYNLRMFGRDFEEFMTRNKAASYKPLLESRRERFQQKYGRIKRELEEMYKIRNESSTSINTKESTEDLCKLEECTTLIKPKYNVMGPRRTYIVSPKKPRKEEIINERFKLIEEDFNAEETNEEIKEVKSNNKEGAAFYDVIEYDNSEDFHVNKTKTNCYLIRVREERTYYLNEVPYLYVTNFNKKSKKMPVFRRNKKVHFNDERQTINDCDGIVNRVLKEIKIKLKILFH